MTGNTQETERKLEVWNDWSTYLKIFGVICIIIGVSYGSYFYFEKTPHCHFIGDGSYSCDVFASKLEKQNMCIMDSLMNSPNQGTTGYNADTGKTYELSKADQKAMYNFIVESCK